MMLVDDDQVPPYYLQDFYPTSDEVQLSCMGRCFKVYFEASRPRSEEGEGATMYPILLTRWRSSQCGMFLSVLSIL